MNELQTTRTLDTVAAEIRTFTASMLNNVIEIGRRLVEAKEMLPYGEFGKWVKENTAYSVSSANNFMRLFNEYGAAQGCLFGAEAESQTFGKLSYSKALALLAVPAEEREEFAETHDVEAMSTRELEQAIRERDEAKTERDLAQAQLEASENLRAEISNKLAGERADLDAAQKKIEELESRPVEVAVEKPDPAELQKQIDEAVAAAVKEAKDAAAADRKKLKDKLSETEKRRDALEVELKNAQTAAEAKEKALVERQAGIVSMEKERMERQIEELKKQLAMSDAAVVTFQTLFAQVQDLLNRLIGAMEKAPDDETRAKLRAAVRKLLDVYGGKVDG